MKLVRLKINSKFRSLYEGFEINFHTLEHPFADDDTNIAQFHPFCFAGLNGSGKSNVLEALAEIFYFLDCSTQPKIKLPENFKTHFNPSLCRDDLDSFELEYLIGQHNNNPYALIHMQMVSVVKKKREVPVVKIKSFPFDDTVDWKPISIVQKEKEPADFKLYLPDFIIGYSSGENEILSIPFIKSRLLQYDEYVEAMEGELFYEEPENKLIYIDSGMSQAVLLANLIFQEDNVLKPLKEELGVCDMHSFRINLNLHPFNFKRKLKNGEPNHILGYLEKSIEDLKKCSTCFYQYTHKEDGKEFERLILDFWVNKATKDAIREYFNHDVFKLFRLFQVLYFLNSRVVTEQIKEDVYQSKGYYTDGKIPVPAPSDHTFYFLEFFILKQDKGDLEPKKLLLRNFSDGEHQFIHTLGICSMLKGRRCLLLLDEPETHFNPSWRGKFIRILKESVSAAEPNNQLKDIIITSHSPFIISDCFPEQVIYFKKNERCVKAKELNFKTFGTSVDIILEVLFGKRQSIGDLSRSKLAYNLSDIKTKEQAQVIKDNINKLGLGDSLEKDLLFANLNEIIKNEK
jgi:restriction system-associated AAA family ATPase